MIKKKEKEKKKTRKFFQELCFHAERFLKKKKKIRIVIL